MILSEEIKNKIINEYNDWFEHQYAGKTKKERQKLGAFFTPPQLTIKMIEKFENLSGNILDPACGCGGLLAGVIMAGANPQLCFGIELDENIAYICKKRLAKLNVPEKNIKIGNALDSDSYNFEIENNAITHDQKALYFEIVIENNFKYISFKILNFPNKIIKNFEIKLVKENILKIYSIFKKCSENNYWFITNKDVNDKIKTINNLFKVICNNKLCIEKLLEIELNKIEKIIEKNKFNSFDDLEKLQELKDYET